MFFPESSLLAYAVAQIMTELRILTSNSSRTVLDALAPAYERASGNRCAVTFDTARRMLERIRNGESGDLVILGAAVVTELARSGIVAPGSSRLFARSRVGVAVRAGAPKPDISTVESFRRALLDARSVAHTVYGASGMYVPELLRRLGIAGEMQPKIVNRTGGYIGGVVASGEAELAIQQIVELLAVPGIDLVGPLPDELQKVFETAIGVFAASRQTEDAARLLQFLLAPANAGVFREKGLEQAGSG